MNRNTQLSFGSRISSQSRNQKRYNKSRELQLPQINRTTFVVPDKNHRTGFDHSYLPKIEWLVQTRDYTEVSEKQILNQYQRLRKQLIYINEEVVRALEKIQSKPQKLKTLEKDLASIIQVQEKEIDNSNNALEMHRKEYAQLVKRTQFVTSGNKKNIEEEIMHSKESIIKVKQRIKELKKKNQLMGIAIINSDQIFDQISQFQQEKDNHQKRKLILEKKVKNAEQAIISTQKKITALSQHHNRAEQFFHQLFLQKQVLDNQQKYQFEVRNKKQLLEVTRKKQESSIHLKQQKYHQVLRQYEMQVERQKKTMDTIGELQMQSVNARNSIHSLQQTLKNLYQQKAIIKQQERLKKEEEDSFLSRIRTVRNHDKEESPSDHLSPNQKSYFTAMGQSVKGILESVNGVTEAEVRKLEEQRVQESDTIQFKRNSFGHGIKLQDSDLDILDNEISDLQDKITQKPKFSIDLGKITEKLEELQKGKHKSKKFDQYFDEDL